MKKLLVLSTVLIVLLCGCDVSSTKSDVFSQEITIIKMPSPPKCKTSDKIADVDALLEILGLIDKSPISTTAIESDINGWEIMIKLKIDNNELVYTIGEVFTDADGTQYKIENLDVTKEKINKIYDRIDAPEVEYK